jgi:ubiquinone/menaquinone biosynthesis C-methylase UbiE
MPNPKGKAIMFQESCVKQIEMAHKIYAKFPFLKKDYAMLKSLPRQATVLDVGCGEGRFLKRASMIRSDLKLSGLDIDVYLESIKPQDLEGFALSDSNKPLPFKEETFDFIHCSHIIEHLNQPFLFLKEVFRILKKNASVYIETPEAKTVFYPSLGTTGSLNFYDDPTHIRPYTKESLRRLALQAGFKETDIKVFFARNGFNLLFLPYALFKFLTTGRNVYMGIILNPLLGSDVGGIFVKN